jgi:hypothetical protein
VLFKPETYTEQCDIPDENIRNIRVSRCEKLSLDKKISNQVNKMPIIVKKDEKCSPKKIMPLRKPGQIPEDTLGSKDPVDVK